MQYLRNIFYSFPVQLVLLHLKYHQIILLFWVLLFVTVSGAFGKSLGIPYLLLAPEYLGHVDYYSFGILGMAFGAFLITWNITTYLLNSYRFPFLATLDRPFAMFVINNSVIPLSFIITYLIIDANFLSENEFANVRQIAVYFVGFFTGIGIVIILTAIYFQFTNKNIFAMFGLKPKQIKKFRGRGSVKREMEWQDYTTADEVWRVDYFITSTFRLRHIRKVAHYEEQLLTAVFRQHHSNALVAELVTLAVLIALGLLIEYRAFRIPAGASSLFMLTTLLILSGALSYWMKGWKNAVIIFIIIIINFMVQYDVFTYKNQAYGLDYSKPYVEYELSKLKEIASDENILQDRGNTLQILDNWKRQTGEEKPRMVIINASGGGLSSALFTMRTLQLADSLSGGELMSNTMMMTGASGGMFGAAYLRELYLRRQKNEVDNPYSLEYCLKLSNDMLNPVIFTLVVNDILYPWQKFNVGDYTYKKDRGYMMEKALNENTDYAMDKTLADYREPEYNATVPMMILSPTIINDERKLYISSQPVSYLMKPGPVEGDYAGEIDGVDFGRFFANKDAYNLKLTSALRMNSTYPYILPNVFLPSSPYMEVMDAGFRDNYGIGTTIRFLHVFKDWINENTGGVIIIQIKGWRSDEEIEEYNKQTIFTRFFNPVGNLLANWENIQNYNHSYMINFAASWLNVDMDHLIFYNVPQEAREKAAMSLHLTSKEKVHILEATMSEQNRPVYDKLNDLLR